MISKQPRMPLFPEKNSPRFAESDNHQLEENHTHTTCLAQNVILVNANEYETTTTVKASQREICHLKLQMHERLQMILFQSDWHLQSKKLLCITTALCLGVGRGEGVIKLLLFS